MKIDLKPFRLATAMQMFRKWMKKWLRKRRIKKICKANRYFCPDCIYHEHIFEGAVFRGTRCRLENRQ